MKLKKINAMLALLALALMILHIGYSCFAYLTFYYNPFLTKLFAIPFMVLACLHAVCGMAVVFFQADGTRADLYPKQNLRTILQRGTAALIFPLLFLHINTFDMLKSSGEGGHLIVFWLVILGELLFFAVVLTHIAVSVTRALITMGWLGSEKIRNCLDLTIYIICGAVFVVLLFSVVRGQVVMF